LASPAIAQFSDSYNFIKAVKDRDGEKVMSYLNKPGQPVLNTRDGESGDTALLLVTRGHDSTYANFLLARGADPNLRDKSGNPPLNVAAQTGDIEIARLLIGSRANVNATNNSGETALIIAVQHRDAAMTRLLISAGANPAIADTIAGKSARDYASEDRRGNAMLKILDEAKPKIDPSKISGPILPH